jgi:aldehyde:ferredoxin oxidoreductase
LKEGATAGIEPGIDIMLNEFYDVSKWDGKIGKPKKEKLMELELTEVAKDLWR